MRIVALHRLPFDPAAFEDDVASFPAGREQYRNNWKNAWIIVIEHDSEPDFDSISWPNCEPDAQAPWLERVVSAREGVVRAAFFLHFLDPALPLHAGGELLTFPAVTTSSRELVQLMAYSSPD